MPMDTAERQQLSAREPTAGRVGGRGPGLPRARAVLGGFLVALSAVGLFAAYRRAEAPPAASYAVVTTDIAPGERLDEADVALVPIDLPEAQAATAYSDVASLVGAVANSALSADEVLAVSDVRTSVGYAAAGELSFEMPASHALSDSLAPGERIDVVAAYGSGTDAYTDTVARDALLISRQAGDTFAGSDAVVVRLGLDHPDAALALAHAVTQAEVFLLRSPGGGPADGPYRPDGLAAATRSPGGSAPPPGGSGDVGAGDQSPVDGAEADGG